MTSLFLSGLLSVALANPPAICVDTLECGGYCGTVGDVNSFLAQCNNDADPNGPCLDECWNSCLHAAENSNNPNPTFCTLECVSIDCPGPAEQSGLESVVTETCPVPDPEVICPLYFDPVTCGTDDCSYSNSCFAGAAGFAAGQCTQVDDGPVQL